MTEKCNECKKDIDLNKLHIIRRYPFMDSDNSGTDYYHMSCHDRIERFSEFIVDEEQYHVRRRK